MNELEIESYCERQAARLKISVEKVQGLRDTAKYYLDTPYFLRWESAVPVWRALRDLEDISRKELKRVFPDSDWE